MERADLQEDEVKQILRKAIEGWSGAKIARWKGCNPETVRRILRGETHISVREPGDEMLKTRHEALLAYAKHERLEDCGEAPIRRVNLKERARLEAEEQKRKEDEEINAGAYALMERLKKPVSEETKEVAAKYGIVLQVEEADRPEDLDKILATQKARARAAAEGKKWLEAEGRAQTDEEAEAEAAATQGKVIRLG